MPASLPAKDLSDPPADWLEAYAVLLCEDDCGDSFVREIEAIYRLRDIEVRDGYRRSPRYQEAVAELVRRGLREPEPEPELITRTAAADAIAAAWGEARARVRYFVSWLPVVHRGGRQWYRTADVRRFIETDGRAYADITSRRTAV